MNQKEQSRLQVLKSLLSEHVVSDQAVMLMEVRARYTRRILVAYGEAAASLMGFCKGWPINSCVDTAGTGTAMLFRHDTDWKMWIRYNSPHQSGCHLGEPEKSVR